MPGGLEARVQLVSGGCKLRHTWTTLCVSVLVSVSVSPSIHSVPVCPFASLSLPPLYACVFLPSFTILSALPLPLPIPISPD